MWEEHRRRRVRFLTVGAHQEKRSLGRGVRNGRSSPGKRGQDGGLWEEETDECHRLRGRPRRGAT
jgi:hypothetical protein